ncbi:MAG TPA: bifunctional phosphoribosylaminoimidazolecarboxamide formyltransferase/IMP cyclohydrolase [Candidatus Obscuribacterales bacterium]
MRTVLVSVSDKSGLESFLRRLERFGGLRLIATGNTYKFLTEHGFKCLKVEELTQFPEILSGRVKTLHPKVFAGILARPIEEDRSTLAQHDIQEIDVVVVNLYPFEKKLAEGLSEPDMIEQIDIGGVTLLRAAAKNFERVSIVSDPGQYEGIVESLEVNSGKFTDTLRKELAYAAFRRTALYDQAISGYLGSTINGKSNGEEAKMPQSVAFSLNKHQDLRYGENPHSAAAWYAPPAISPALTKDFPPFEQLQGKELSFNNIVDVYALFRILRDLNGPGACIIKHNNPCGVALDNDVFKAFEKAYDCDPISAFGGIYGFTAPVDAKLAERVTRDFIEIVAAPSFDKEALAVLAKKKNVRVLKVKPSIFERTFNQSLRFKDLQEMGFVVEQDMEPWVGVDKFKCVTEEQLDASYIKDVEFAWSVQKHLTSNAIFVARNGLSLGFGIGQTNRVASVRLAVEQAGERAKGAVLASDAFFPATDNIETAAKAGIKVIVQPGGSIKDQDVIAACNKHKMVMMFTGQRCFKH